MGANESHEEGQPQESNGDIKIVVESGLHGGNPKYGRKWHGTVVATLFVKPDITVASFFDTVMAIPLPKNHWPVTLSSLYMGNFRPSNDDLQRTVGEMGLVSGTLQLYNGAAD